jgi:hypothetical protein
MFQKNKNKPSVKFPPWKKGHPGFIYVYVSRGEEGERGGCLRKADLSQVLRVTDEERERERELHMK